MNGYTSIIEDKDVSLNEFVWRCARALGPLNHMRDSDMDAPIVLPNNFHITYHTERLQESQDSLLKYQKMSIVEAQGIADQEWVKNQEEAKEGLSKKNELLIRTKNLLQQVQNWSPPSADHEGIKTFMIEQLQNVISHDCDTSYCDRILKEKKLSAVDWLQQKISWLEADVVTYTNYLAKANEREDFSTKWILDLQGSIPLP